MQPNQTAQDRFAATLIRTSSRGLATLAAEALVHQNPDLQSRFPKEGVQGDSIAVWSAKLETRLLYLATALSTSRPELFVESVTWARIAWQKREVPEGDLLLCLLALRDVLEEKLPAPAARRATEFIQRAQDEFSCEAQEPSSFIDVESPLGRLAAEYLLEILQGNQKQAVAVVTNAARSGFAIPELYTEVLAPAMREVGRLWMVGDVHIGEEHFATSTTEMAITVLQAESPDVPSVPYSVVGASVEDNHHSLGIHMVTDLFRMSGWRAVFLGSSMPHRDLARSALDFGADLLALSVTLSPQIQRAAELIRVIRSHDELANLPILLGGQAFASAPDLWKDLGANGFAHDLQSALDVGTRLVTQK